jgi:hypothetical protein
MDKPEARRVQKKLIHTVHAVVRDVPHTVVHYEELPTPKQEPQVVHFEVLPAPTDPHTVAYTVERPTPKQTDAEFDAQIDAWREKYGDQDDNEPLAETVRYDQRLKLLLVGLTNGQRLALPIENLQGLKSATVKQLQKVEIHNLGTAISFPDLDADFYVPSLMKGLYGNRRWMAELGKRGGAATTEAKQIAARTNGAKGGRPKKVAAVATRPMKKIAAVAAAKRGRGAGVKLKRSKRVTV